MLKPVPKTGPFVGANDLEQEATDGMDRKRKGRDLTVVLAVRIIGDQKQAQQKGVDSRLYSCVG